MLILLRPLAAQMHHGAFTISMRRVVSESSGVPRLVFPCASPSPSRRPVMCQPLPSEEGHREVEQAHHDTLAKPNTPRRVSSSSSAATLEPTASSHAFDPALVVRHNSRTGQLHLNPVQKSLVWKARSQQYQQTLETIVLCLQSHLTPIEKSLRLLHVHETVVIPHRLRLRTDTYEDLFHAWFATATIAPTPHGGTEDLADASPTAFEEDVVRCGEHWSAVHSPDGLPPELATRAAAALALTSDDSVSKVWVVYRYMIDSGTNPSPKCIQHLMGLLERCARRKVAGSAAGAAPPAGLTLLEGRCHSLMMDIDRFQLLPTEYTLRSYIYVCQVSGVMHLALARVTDFQTRLGQQPSSATYAMLLRGFRKQAGHGKEELNGTNPALALLTTLRSTPISTHLLNEMLLVGRGSSDPLSAFTIYQSVMSRRTREGSLEASAAAAAGLLFPSIHTFSILLEALLVGAPKYPHAAGSLLPFLLREMKRYGIKGNTRMLNKLLRCFWEHGEKKNFYHLRYVMLKKNVIVFDELRKLK